MMQYFQIQEHPVIWFYFRIKECIRRLLVVTNYCLPMCFVLISFFLFTKSYWFKKAVRSDHVAFCVWKGFYGLYLQLRNLKKNLSWCYIFYWSDWLIGLDRIRAGQEPDMSHRQMQYPGNHRFCCRHFTYRMFHYPSVVKADMNNIHP